MLLLCSRGGAAFRANAQAGRRTGYSSSASALNMAGFGAKPKSLYTGKLKPGKLSPTSKVPKGIARPDYAIDGKPKNAKEGFAWTITPQTPEDIVRMEVSGRIAREVLDAAIRMVKPGITTDAIDQQVHAETIARNSYPSPLNYNRFPKSCCTSVNEIICHGIPDSTILNEGDIINIDVTIFHDGVHGDCSETVFVGKVSDEVRDLVVTTYEAWQAAIAFCKPGRKYSDIGGIIEDIIKPKGYATVREFCGHG
jgi:methionyl aminopeptidase